MTMLARKSHSAAVGKKKIISRGPEDNKVDHSNTGHDTAGLVIRRMSVHKTPMANRNGALRDFVNIDKTAVLHRQKIEVIKRFTQQGIVASPFVLL
jgi:hypothetical protein